jgi:hypothetical protein
MKTLGDWNKSWKFKVNKVDILKRRIWKKVFD